MLKTILFIAAVLLTITIHSSFGQSAFLPQNLGATVNSTYDDINPVISPDGKYLYFVRVNHPDNTYGAEDSEDIWFSELTPNGTWSQAKRMSLVNVARYNSILSVNAKGQALISGVFNKKGTFWKKRGLSIIDLDKGNASIPRFLRVKRLSRLNRGIKFSGMMAEDGQVIVLSFSRAYNSKRSNLFYCKVKANGKKYNRIRPFRTLNTKLNEDAPFLSANNKTLYFSSDRDAKGEYSIYKTTRTADDWKTWSTPKKLSDTINTKGWDSYFKTNKKGSWAYFASTTKSIGGSDIYRIKLFEENPFIVVSGKIIHSQNRKPLIHKNVSLHLANDSKTIPVNEDSATYSIKLPLGKKYTLEANTEHYSTATAVVDASKLKEFTTLHQDILIGPQPYVMLKGRLLSLDKEIIPQEARPRIIIDGVVADSAVLDSVWAAYTLKVKFGGEHKISVTANGYKSIVKDLDLSAIDEYQLIDLDLFAEEDKVALIYGKVLDKKTNTPVASTLPVAIRVEGMTHVRASRDSLAGTYELKLPLASAFTVSASAPGYYPLYENIDLKNETRSVKVNRDLVIVPIEVGQSIRLNNIFFETGKAALKKESFPELDRVASFLKDNPDIKIEIGGHTDNVGKAASNQKLSQARAVAVSTYIISKGLPQQNIVSKGYGSTKPVTSNSTADGKAQNRRVEFTILDK